MNIDKLHIVESGALSVSERKASLRSYMKKRRGENENRDVKEALLLENFLKSGAAERESFFIYMSFSSEAPTDKLIAYLLAQNKRVYCPRTENGEIVPVEYGEDFSLSPYGIREPLGKAYEGKIDAAFYKRTAERIGADCLLELKCTEDLKKSISYFKKL